MEILGEIANIWRYPVKSLAPQPLEQTAVEPGGLPGDRASALFVESGHARTGKPYRGKEHNLLHTTADAGYARELAANRGVSLSVRDEDEHYFDAAPVSIVFDRWIDEVARALDEPMNPLRWRPNFFARSMPGFAYGEAGLTGAVIEAGTCVLRVRKPIERCVTITYDVQTGEQNDAVLLYVAQKRANTMGIYCDVEVAGTVRVGDALRLRDR
ncbi:MAG TPA: MOSC domain-containing protein [Candidatus Baltobacteraceae bacterium]|jgi:hypothetical protein|nr:MOSC domain-containing protein [Candidatus Baltobacteraceae bacterium]